MSSTRFRFVLVVLLAAVVPSMRQYYKVPLGPGRQKIYFQSLGEHPACAPSAVISVA